MPVANDVVKFKIIIMVVPRTMLLVGKTNQILTRNLYGRTEMVLVYKMMGYFKDLVVVLFAVKVLVLVVLKLL